MISSFLCLSVFFHYASQGTRIYWYDHVSSNVMPGTLPINVTFFLSIIFGVAAGIVQGSSEGKLKKKHPDKWPPGASALVKEFYQKWRSGEIRLCSLKTLKEFMAKSKEEKAKWTIANELKRMKTASSSTVASAMKAISEPKPTQLATTASPPPSPAPLACAPDPSPSVETVIA